MNPFTETASVELYWLPLGAENITTHNYSFLFNEPGIHYMDWIKNTLVVGGIVVLITLALSIPAGYALARLSGGWGQSAGVGIFLVYLVPPTLLFLPSSRTRRSSTARRGSRRSRELSSRSRCRGS